MEEEGPSGREKALEKDGSARRRGSRTPGRREMGLRRGAGAQGKGKSSRGSSTNEEKGLMGREEGILGVEEELVNREKRLKEGRWLGRRGPVQVESLKDRKGLAGRYEGLAAGKKWCMEGGIRGKIQVEEISG